MKTLKIICVVLLLCSLTVDAEPIINWLFTQDYHYENNNPIDPDDIWTWDLECNNTPDEQGEPYEMGFPLLAGPDSINDIDMAPLVQVGGVGTYWCAAAAYSLKYQSRSDFSNEKDFTVTAQQTGFVPVAPVIQ